MCDCGDDNRLRAERVEDLNLLPNADILEDVRFLLQQV